MLLDFKENNYQEFFAESDVIPTNPNEDNGDGYYGYIPAIVTFENLVEYIPEISNPKIVDLGAGYCENLLYLGHVLNSTDLHGVESNSNYISDMTALITNHSLPIQLHNADYSEHDITSYDVIYSFCIAKRQPEYNDFNEYVLNNMKVGAVWIEALGHNPDIEGSVLESIESNANSFEILYNENNIIIVKKI